MAVQVYVSRRNLLTLLSKLDRKLAGEQTLCTIVKGDTTNPKYPQSHRSIIITAVENDDYYTDREAGVVLPQDTPA